MAMKPATNEDNFDKLVNLISRKFRSSSPLIQLDLLCLTTVICCVAHWHIF